MHRPALALLACTLIILAGCRQLTTPKVVPPRAAAAPAARGAPQFDGPVLPITSPVEVRFHETLTPNGRPFCIRCRTTSQYPYLNYPLLARVDQRERSVTVEFTGVGDPGGGPCMPGPARGAWELAVPRGGRYNLLFKVRGEVVPTGLVIHPDSFEVTNAGGRLVQYPMPVLHRVPPGTIWGAVGWGPVEWGFLAQRFLDSLTAAGAQPKKVAPGDYEYFQVDRDGNLLPLVTFPPHSTTFLCSFEGDKAAIPRIMRRFAGSLYMYVFDDLGQSWRNTPTGWVEAAEGPARE